MNRWFGYFLCLPLSYCFALSLPEEFTVSERFFSVLSTFDIASEGVPIALATKRLFALAPTYDLEDPESQPLATARAQFFSWGTIAEIEDPAGTYLGRIEENLWRIFPWAEYKVFDRQNNQVMTATMDFLGTEFTLTDSSHPDHVIATISRPLIRLFRDDWSIHIHDDQLFVPDTIDPLFLVLLAVYQTDKDNRTRFFYEYKNQLRKELELYEGNRIQ